MADVLNRTTMQLLSSVNTPDYPSSDWIINPDLSAVAGVAVKYWKVAGDVVAEMDQSEKDVVDAAELAEVKKAARAYIDDECERRIHDGPGFEYPPTSGQFFSLSANAQIKWVGLAVGADYQSYPLTVMTVDDSVSYDIQDANEARTMYALAAGAVKDYLALATIAKVTVNAATTEADVAAAVNDYLGG